MSDASPPSGLTRLRLDPPVPAFDGREFGGTGDYEWIRGTALCALDPQHPLNRPIALLDHAPCDRDGRVSYEVDLAILRPADPARGNGWLLYDVLNRGTKRAVHRINSGAASNHPATPAEAGTGFLMREGYTLVWSGWQHDVPLGGGRMAARLPVARGPDGPLAGWSREEFILDAPAAIRDDGIEEASPTVFTYRLSYPAADPADPSARLSLRQNEGDARTGMPRPCWRFIDPQRIEVTHGLTADGGGAPDRGAIWEFIYRARDPVVAGIGLASIRDVVAFLRHAQADAAGTENPLAGRIRRAMGFGLSQSGRVLRDFLHEGFNEDLSGRAVFEAVMPVIAGSRRAFVNMPFAQPGRFSRQHEDHSFPGDQFPFTYGTVTDPVSGRTDGILARAAEAGVAPKIVHLDSESEVFSARTSLVVTDTEGRDLALPENVRVYVAAGVAHGDYPLPAAVARTAGNTLTYGALARALVRALRDWVETGAFPPPSRHPTRADGTLVPLADAARAFPSLPQTPFPDRMNGLRLMDHAVQPPAAGASYPVFVGTTDADGNAAAGVPHPLALLPLGTHTGWQLRRPGFAAGELMNVFGAFIPFARTRAEREASGDPRPSLEERYGTAAGWRERLAAALPALVAAGYLLEEDAEAVLAQAAAGYPETLNAI